MRRGLKEAAGKTLARRTEIAYEAVAVGKKSNIFKAQFLYGNCGRKCGGYKCEGRVHYPGRSAYLPLATAVVRRRDGWTEVSRSRSRWCDQPLKGGTCKTDWEPATSMIKAVAERSAETRLLTGKGSGQSPREYPAKATKITAVAANSHEEPI